jgi:hypothetical protein
LVQKRTQHLVFVNRGLFVVDEFMIELDQLVDCAW